METQAILQSLPNLSINERLLLNLLYNWLVNKENL